MLTDQYDQGISSTEAPSAQVCIGLCYIDKNLTMTEIKKKKEKRKRKKPLMS